MTDDEVASILMKSSKPSAKKSLSDEDVARILMKQETPEEQSLLGREFRLVGENVAKGAIDLADIPEAIAYGGAGAMGEAFGKRINEKINPGTEYVNPYKGKEPQAGKAIESGIKAAGVDLNTIKPESGGERILAKASRFLGSALPTGFTGGVRSAAKGLLGMFGAGTVAGGLHEAGVPEPLADIAGAVGTPLGVMAAKNAPRAGKSIMALFSPAAREKIIQEGAEASVADYLQNVVMEGPNGVPEPKQLQEAIQNIERNLGETNIPGYQPLTAEASGNMALSQMHRARMGPSTAIGMAEEAQTQALTGALERQRKGPEGLSAAQEHLQAQKAAIESQQAADLMNMPDLTAEAGAKVRTSLFEKMKKHKKERAEATEPLYQKVRESKETLNPKETIGYIDKELEVAKGDIKDVLVKTKKLLEPNKVSKSGADEALGKMAKVDPKMYQLLSESGHIKGGARYQELENSRKAINDLIGDAKKAGHAEKARALTGVRKQLDAELETIPGIKEARQKYAELSEPISEMNATPGIKQALKKDQFEKKFILGDSEVPEKFIAGSMKSKENAAALKKQLQGSPDALESLENYTMNKAAKEIVDEYGKVSPAKLNAWNKKNEGAFELYPTLKTKLANTTNAQMMVNTKTAESQKLLNQFNQGVAKDILKAESPKTHFESVLSKQNAASAMTEARSLLSSDKTGGALNAYRNAATESMLQKVQTSGEGITYHKMNEYMKQNRKALEALYEPEQIKVMDEVVDALKKRKSVRTRGQGVGSNTVEKGANLAHAMLYAVSDKGTAKLLSKLPGADLFMKPFHAIMKTDANIRAENLIKRALVDKEFALSLLKRPQEQAAGDAIKYITSHWKKAALPIASSLVHGEE